MKKRNRMFSTVIAYILVILTVGSMTGCSKAKTESIVHDEINKEKNASELTPTQLIDPVVIKMINDIDSIGMVDITDEELIYKLIDRYKNLPDSQKEKITNYIVLLNAEEKLDELKANAPSREVEPTVTPTPMPTATPRPTATPTPSTSLKIYPERDTNLSRYKSLKEAPEIVYSTYASENGLGNNCYYIQGTVVGVYASTYDAFVGLGKDAAAKHVADMPDYKTIIIDTEYGRAMITDIFSYNVSTYQIMFDSKSIKKMEDKYTYFSRYQDYPQKGDKVKVLVIYNGYSTVAQLPSFYYGINDYIIEISKS